MGDLDPAIATRVIRVKLTVPKPKTVEVAAVSTEPGGVELKVA